MKWPHPFRLSLSLLLLLSLLILPQPRPLDAADARWSEIPLPRTGSAGDWMLTPDTDIVQLEADSQGRLYAWLTGDDGGLFRSDEAIARFTRLYPSDAVPVVLTITGDNRIYFATEAAIFRSLDGGNTFQLLAGVPGGAGNSIIDMDIQATPRGDLVITAVAGDAPGTGGIYLYDESQFFGAWQDAGLGTYEALAVRFSPDFEVDRTLLALATDDQGTYILKFTTSNWHPTELRLPDDTPVSAQTGSIYLPAGETLSSSPFYVTMEGNTPDSGGIWLVFAQTSVPEPIAYPLPAEPGNYTSFSIGENILTAGTAAGEIHTAGATGLEWTPASRHPGGSRVVDIVDLGTDQFVASTGTGGGLFRSTDRGLTWQPALFIDQVAVGSLVEILPSANYETDNTLYLLSFDNGHVLWGTGDDGLSWRRLLGAGDFNIATIEHITATDNGLLVTAIDTEGTGLCLFSADRGLSFQVKPLPAMADSLNGFAAAGPDELFFTTFDGNQARLWRSEPDSPLFASVPAGDVRLTALELSPDFTGDSTLVTVAVDGRVFISVDGGRSLTELPSLAVTGSVRLSFDPHFAASARIYATGEQADSGIFRLTVGQAEWERIDSGLPAGTLPAGLAVSADGIIYATSRTHDTGGLIRALAADTIWYIAGQGLPTNASMTDLVSSDSRLWALDTTNNRIMTWNDSLAEPVALASPPAGAGGLGTFVEGKTDNIRIEWNGRSGATGYEWQVADNSGMSNPLLDGTTSARSVTLESLFPGTTYYWRVRAVTPVPGPWSEKRSFTTALGGVATVPELVTPLPGATATDIRPFFQWRPVAGADRYELLVSTDASFSNLIINEATLSSTAWRPPLSLEAGQTYFWKVRAVSESSVSAWSAASGFATETPAAPTTTSESPTLTTTIAADLNMPLPEWLIMTLAGAGGAVVLLLVALVVSVRNRRVL